MAEKLWDTFLALQWPTDLPQDLPVPSFPRFAHRNPTHGVRENGMPHVQPSHLRRLQSAALASESEEEMDKGADPENEHKAIGFNSEDDEWPGWEWLELISSGLPIQILAVCRLINQEAAPILLPKFNDITIFAPCIRCSGPLSVVALTFPDGILTGVIDCPIYYYIQGILGTEILSASLWTLALCKKRPRFGSDDGPAVEDEEDSEDGSDSGDVSVYDEYPDSFHIKIESPEDEKDNERYDITMHRLQTLFMGMMFQDTIAFRPEGMDCQFKFWRV
ncbi:hypothetical protein BU23DRAFT_600067 [Bimuria novae-zelandiae CBS 107.79]|uniref:Uncharacterized protein n=1 Tax=Bimuria novae-zelandiae CBS 107.79 TaxID=1447943 RepID=A0A6A5V726_9PLEO|nr:hypothetical protein BU23DRAFT_600067 [Bimuria novae-zelandiae CBS 107.79]